MYNKVDCTLNGSADRIKKIGGWGWKVGAGVLKVGVGGGVVVVEKLGQKRGWGLRDLNHMHDRKIRTKKFPKMDGHEKIEPNQNLQFLYLIYRKYEEILRNLSCCRSKTDRVEFF